MPPENRTKTLHYKRAEIVGVPPTPLSELLHLALSRGNPMSRMERLGQSNDNVRLVNRPYQKESMLCGCMLDFTEGNQASTVRLVDDIELAIEQIPPRDLEQFIEGMLFF